jgi:rhamnulokinase
MKRPPAFVGVDLGAESGRVVAGTLDRGRVELQQVSRFANQPVRLPGGLHWDVLGLFRESLAGITLAAKTHAVQGIAYDSWGVDYGVLDERGRLLGLPFHYRDLRTDALVDRASPMMASSRAYETTGIRPMPINTVYQLLAEADSPALRCAHRLALIPDLMAFWLCGTLANERTVASTTGLLDARTGVWADELISALGLPGIFGHTIESGTVLGRVLPVHGVAQGRDDELQVLATAGHDTAAAFAGAPVEGGRAAVLSSGTWSLLGVETDEPVLTDAAREAGLSNERGVFGSMRLLRNVMGLWLLQQCRAAWAVREPGLDYETLAGLASSSTAEPVLFDPDHPSLALPGDIPGRIEALMRAGGQCPPGGRGDFVRSIFVSLACKYRLVLDLLERVTGRSIDSIHVVGGGSRNHLLCQLTADITGRDVLSGPAEATALGNVLVQACALGYATGFDEMRALARASFAPVRCRPSVGVAVVDAIYRRFLETTGLGSTGYAAGERGGT